MGVLSTNRAQITSGGLISASFVSDVYDVLTGATADTVVISGSTTNHGLSISGSLNVSSTISASYITGSFTGNIIGNVTGNLTGTSSFATMASTASYVSGSSVSGTVVSATTSTSASFATTAITASYISNTLSFQTGSLGTAINGAMAVSSSGDLYFGSASAWYKVTLG